MTAYRISATMLDAFDLYRIGRINEQSLIETFERRDIPPNAAMRAGKAFHRLMETENREGLTLDAKNAGKTIDGITFFTESDVHPLNLPATKPDDETEVKSIDDFHIHRRVQLTGVADVVTSDGTIRDWKTTTRPGNLERYIQAWQWRVYLMLFPSAHTFEYVQVPMKETIPDTWVLYEASTLRLHPYADMHTDLFVQLNDIVNALDTWIDIKRLDGSKLQPR